MACAALSLPHFSIPRRKAELLQGREWAELLSPLLVRQKIVRGFCTEPLRVRSIISFQPEALGWESPGVSMGCGGGFSKSMCKQRAQACAWGGKQKSLYLKFPAGWYHKNWGKTRPRTFHLPYTTSSLPMIIV